VDGDGAKWSQVLGATARCWAPCHEVGPDWWVALTGAPNVDYNVAFCRSSDPAVLGKCCVQPVLEMRTPGMVMVSGDALGSVQQMADLGWVNVGALPLMVMPARPLTGSTEAVVLSHDELPGAREILMDTYGLDERSAAAAYSDRAIEHPDVRIWGLYEEGRLMSAMAVAVDKGMVGGWSMATRPRAQGRGFGRRLLTSLLDQEFANGASGSVLHSSAAGLRLYRSLGYEAVEHWQLWSRPRWVMGRA
jgi:GNAT superfamily N-acetyltransferase